MINNKRKEFGRFRSLFLPVHTNELKLFVPLLLIFFVICFNYNVLRVAKDSLVITAPSSGAEIIPFVKVWVILPMALVMTLLFSRLSSKYTTEKVFYIMMTFFLGSLAFFSFVLFPLKEVLHPHRFADYLEGIFPIGLKGFISIIRNWTYTIFYIIAELWGTTIMTVLFWGFTNEILSVKTAKRFYVLILFGGNLSAICAGATATMISNFSAQLTRSSTAGEDPWRYSLFLLCGIVIVGGGIIMMIFRWLHKNVLENPLHQHQVVYTGKKSSIEMGVRKNFKYLASSKYLLFMAAMVLTCNICINLTEITWKDQLFHLCPHPNDFNGYMGKVTLWVGIVATLVAIISSIIIRKFSWTFNALIPPVLSLITGVGFFLFLLFKESNFGITLSVICGSTPTILAVFFGSVQQCIFRASKYTIFDATKELAFIPLNKESKLKGKAAIDGIGSRLGKSGSALVYQALLMFFGTVSATVPYVGFVLLIVIVAWIVAVYALGKQFQSLITQYEPTISSSEASSEEREEVII